MFIDEMFEDLLVNKKMMYPDAFAEVCSEKLSKDEDRTFVSVRQIDNGYRCFVRKYPKFNPEAFRNYVLINSPELAKNLGWE